MLRYYLVFGCYYAIFSSLIWNIVVIASPSLSAEDIIWKVNENVQPKPFENLNALSNPPPELHLDPSRGLVEQLFEGCITLEKKEKDALISASLNSDESNPVKRRVISSSGKRWQAKNIPYKIADVGFSGQSKEILREHIERVLEQLASVTCLTFRPKRDNDSHWLQFYDGFGCHADLGKKSAEKLPTQISIGKGCLADSVIMHLLLHGLGFLHEMNRVDRDNFIDIHWDNIKAEYQEIFRRHSYNGVDILNGQYDYHSIMHFSKYTYGDGKQTMAAKSDPSMDLGGLKLSRSDITNIKLFFHCSKFEWKEWGPWSPCSKPCGVGYHRRKRVCGEEHKFCTGMSSEFRSCRISRCHAQPADTTFEDDWGYWKPRSRNNCNWRRGRSRENSQTAGPKQDHTTGSGRFAEVKHGKACLKGVKATIVSERIPPASGERCLAFVYYLNGEGVESLEVQFQDLTSGRPTTVWQKKGGKRKGWVQAAVNLPGVPVSYVLSLVATMGEPDSPSIAVDDIYIDNGKCPEGLGVCEDFSDQCHKWSLAGECYTNAKWMLLSCCKSCLGISDCIDKESDCELRAKTGECVTRKNEMWAKCCKSCEACLDKDNRCSGWAKDGECESNADWMSDNCRKSCNVCKQ